MDDIVKAALARWPNVPHCYDWLALDARGNWSMRDERTQKAGPFPQSRGSRIDHDKLRSFIERNYASDDAGCWFFQNGPQRVYVELEAAPYVWRLSPGSGQPVITSHTGVVGDVVGTWRDESGRLFVQATQGHGIVHTLDMELAATAVEAGYWQPSELPFAQMPERFGYVLSPALRQR